MEMSEDINIYQAPKKSVMVLCHTALGNPNDDYGRYFEPGKEYLLGTEISGPKEDTNWEDCILCWISFNEGFGSRFAVKGNIYHSGNPIWSHFTDYFYCPVAMAREEKLNQLEIL
jgi:hypothetical protein